MIKYTALAFKHSLLQTRLKTTAEIHLLFLGLRQHYDTERVLVWRSATRATILEVKNWLVWEV